MPSPLAKRGMNLLKTFKQSRRAGGFVCYQRRNRPDKEV
jgi:hypothetical protein